VRVSRHDDDCLVFVRRPGFLAVVFAILTFTTLALAIRAFRSGDAWQGAILAILSILFALGMIAMTSFQELRFDRRAGIVERRSLGFFGARQASVALAEVEGVSIDQGDGMRGRRYFRPVLLMRRPPGKTFALSRSFSPFREADQMKRLIDSWLKQAR